MPPDSAEVFRSNDVCLRTFLTAVLGSLIWGFYFGVIGDSSVWYGVVTAVVFALAIATITKTGKRESPQAT